MARIYVSSTFKDLKECREKVKVTLKQMSHEDIAMEYYVAEDKKPVNKCLEDVAFCDLYIGIFAWRYGFVPDGYDKSITELEYRKAVETGKDCLIFLLDEDAPWPAKFVDIGKDAEKVRALRDELSNAKMVSFFKSAEELASFVGPAVRNWEIEIKIKLQTTNQGISSRYSSSESPKYHDKLKGFVTENQADVLLVTATKIESKAILDVFQNTTSQESQLVLISERIYHNVGNVNGKKVFMVQSEMGSGGLGASLHTVQKGIIDLSPNEVIMVGIAFGIDSKKQSIGDILVSKQLMLYELQRVGKEDGNPNIIPRGDKAHASSRLLSYFRSADLCWNESQCKVNFGLILSGEKLVDSIDFRQQLCDLDSEAIGGEMEGSGLYIACHENKVDWILVKSICDWADGNKSEDKENRQKLAAKNAASFVLHMLHTVPFAGKFQEHENVSGSKSILNKSHQEFIIEDNRSLKLTEISLEKGILEQKMRELKERLDLFYYPLKDYLVRGPTLSQCWQPEIFDKIGFHRYLATKEIIKQFEDFQKSSYSHGREPCDTLTTSVTKEVESLEKEYTGLIEDFSSLEMKYKKLKSAH